ncbi:hypothetical protein O6H91_01G134900 [Diphasiastrum complanatum]|uniref:Uncharacterized protein n=1 Tax=Diphasiastrum complanatum TaxID=34168 RepID=A0ACC2EW54_DIPCM|nr:hypothetical protein O6H91_01G134900 [Diphasiastrum complanatum]
MGDFTGSRRSPAKRRRDFDELAPSREGYGSSRGGLLDIGRGYDDQSSGLILRDFATLRASEFARNGLPYGGGGFPSNMGISPAAGLGMSFPGIGGAGFGALDDHALSTRLAAYDAGFGGRAPTLGMKDATLKSESVRSAANILPNDASSTLFVDGLPADCSAREAAHIFRPFIGYKEVRVVHKESKRVDGEKVVLCFVEFADAKCAATALEALEDLPS